MNYLVQAFSCLSFSVGQAIVLKTTYKKILRSDINIHLLFFVMFVLSLGSLILPVMMQLTTLTAAGILVYIKSKKIVSSIIITLIVIIAEFIAMFLPNTVIMFLIPDWTIYRDSPIYNIILSTIFVLSMWGISLVIKKSKLNLISFEKNDSIKIFLVGCFNAMAFAICIFIFTQFFIFEKSKQEQAVSIVYTLLIALFILSNLVSFWMYRIILKSKIRQAEIELKTQLSEKHREATQDMYEYAMSFKHDYLNIYSTMKLYIDELENCELKSFFNENIVPLSSELKEADGSLKSLLLIEDIPLQGILYSFLLKAQKKKINAVISVSEKIPYININIVNLCRALGIFLDNALEACVSAESPSVEVVLAKTDEFVQIVIANPYTGEEVPVVNLFQKHYTTKGEGHGRGLVNAKKVFDECDNANLKIENNNHLFRVTVTIHE